MPSEKNALIDILLARSVTGESPKKRARPRMQQGSSPVREMGDRKPLPARGGQVAATPDMMSLATGQTKISRKPSKEPSGKAPRDDRDDASYDVSPAIGESSNIFAPSKLLNVLSGPNNNVEVIMKNARLGKEKARAEVIGTSHLQSYQITVT